VGRYGGEEFILFLPGATPEQAARVPEQISMTMKNADTAILLPTLSYGIAQVKAAGDALNAAIASADAALYQAKAQGRNQSILATALEPKTRSRALHMGSLGQVGADAVTLRNAALDVGHHISCRGVFHRVKRLVPLVPSR
jgi:predicted signal transduction protein with EAL and GGDEF domain